jgi:peroxiredoxin
MRRLSALAVLVFAAALSAPAPRAEAAAPGDPAPEFTLTDITGRSHSLADFKGRYVVLEWTNYDCPFVRKHYDSGNMQGLQKAYTQKGVAWLTINSSAPGKQGHYEPAEWMRLMQEKKSASTTVLLDSEGTVGRAYGAKTTPHMFVVSPEGTLLYRGAIDDKPSTDPADVKTARNYVQAALDDAMSGQAVSTPQTESYGCSVKY